MTKKKVKVFDEINTFYCTKYRQDKVCCSMEWPREAMYKNVYVEHLNKKHLATFDGVGPSRKKRSANAKLKVEEFVKVNCPFLKVK